MTWILSALLSLATSLVPPTASRGLVLRYRPAAGRTAVYRVSAEMRGKHTLQDETIPVNVRVELEVTEEVTGVEPDGSFWLRVSGRTTRVKDPSGTFAAGQHGKWPVVEVRVSERGEMMEARPRADPEYGGPLQRAFAAAMLQPSPVVMPTGPVMVGDSWHWPGETARQSNRLVSVLPWPGGQGGSLIAHVISSGREPVSLQESSSALGVSAKVSGEVTQRAEVSILLPSGLVASHTGEMRLRTEGETVLELPQGPKSFPLRSDIVVRFDIRLAELDGLARRSPTHADDSGQAVAQP